jgi:two-component system NtrC family sensor kinase
VKDNGVGISQENLKKLFEPFFTTKDIGKGMGLGLSVSYRIIQNHGGKIDITSQPGNGTEVMVTLPVHQVQGNVKGDPSSTKLDLKTG